MANYLAVDIGSSGGKLVLTELTADKKIKTRVVHRFDTPRTWFRGHICINIYRIYDEICETLTRLGKEGVKLSGMGIDAWTSDFGLIDSSGEAVGLPVFYHDKRVEGMMEVVERTIGYEKLYPLTTQRTLRDSTLCQLLAVKRDTPALLEGTRMMSLGDTLMYMFTGRACSELSAASYTQMYSMKRMCWEDSVFDRFALPRSLQTEVVGAGEILGELDPTIADWYGVPSFPVIAPAVHDTASAVAAVPAQPGKKWAFIATGSWFLVGMELDAPANDALSYRYNFSNTGLAFGKNMLKRNILAMWILQECKRAWEEMGLACSYAEIDALAAKAEPFAGFINTEHPSFHSLKDMPQVVVDFLKATGQKRVDKTDIGAIARLIYEGIAFKCRYAIETLEEISGEQIDTVHVIGGASGVPILNEMIASALGREVAAGPREATCIGNSLLQAVGTGELRDAQEIREVVRNNFDTQTVQPREPENWSARYAQFRAVCGLK